MNEQQALDLVKQDGRYFASLSDIYRANEKIAIAAISNYPPAYEFASFGLKMDRMLLALVLDMDGMMLKHAMSNHKNDKQMVRIAVRTTPAALQFASSRLQADKEFKLGPTSLKLASDKDRNDRNIVLVFVAERGMALEHASDELKADPEVVLTAVGQNGMAIVHADVRLQTDLQVCKAALKTTPLCFKVLLPSMQMCRPVVLTAAGLGAAKLIASEFMRDKEIVLAAISNDGFAIQFACPELQMDREIINAALDRDLNSVAVLPKALHDDPVFMRDVLDRDPDLDVYLSGRLRKLFHYDI